MIDRYALQERLRILISEYLKEENIILVDLTLQSQGRKSFLRILVDEPGGGISLERCAYLNNAINQLLDRENLIQTSYVLEVSSPGVDRPLVTRDDFFRCLNRKVRIFLNKPQGEPDEIQGVVASVTDEELNLDSGDEIQHIRFDQIKKAKQLI